MARAYYQNKKGILKSLNETDHEGNRTETPIEFRNAKAARNFLISHLKAYQFTEGEVIDDDGKRTIVKLA